MNDPLTDGARHDEDLDDSSNYVDGDQNYDEESIMGGNSHEDDDQLDMGNPHDDDSTSTDEV